MLQKIKDTYHNIRRHWKLFSVLALSLFVCYKLFVLNYRVQPHQLIVKRDAESYMAVWNERAECLWDLSADKQVRDSANADILN